eukprot:TRINITY_DN4982_c0_g1_i2.p1 TRINITY_DN4982_c0_g1~~TRINITY_DN4982_c0_g1_i2.p1  ORF type:complete len:675 (+),score=140.45 TRINITY_DN4982_c0_g1_i2:242-2026(+)
MLRNLEHPYILKYEGSCEEDGHLLIATEYCKNGDLEKLLEQRTEPFNYQEIMSFFVEICSAVEYLHCRNILHRDLKAANIFLTADGHVKLGDFGIARLLSTHGNQHAETMVGTPFYFSPELCEAKPYDSKSDIWALGVILYQLVSLKRPFEATNIMALVNSIMNDVPKALPRGTPHELSALVRELLSKDPRHRPDITELMRKPIVAEALAYQANKIKHELRQISLTADMQSSADVKGNSTDSLLEYQKELREEALKNKLRLQKEIGIDTSAEFESPEQTKNQKDEDESVGTPLIPDLSEYQGEHRGTEPPSATAKVENPVEYTHLEYQREIRREALRNKQRLENAIREEEGNCSPPSGFTKRVKSVPPMGSNYSIEPLKNDGKNKSRTNYDERPVQSLAPFDPAAYPHKDWQSATPPGVAISPSEFQKSADKTPKARPDSCSVFASEQTCCEQCPEARKLATVHCMECSHHLCDSCSHKIHSLRTFQGHHIAQLDVLDDSNILTQQLVVVDTFCKTPDVDRRSEKLEAVFEEVETLVIEEDAASNRSQQAPVALAKTPSVWGNTTVSSDKSDSTSVPIARPLAATEKASCCVVM